MVYVHGLLPVFSHAANDLASFRLFTSQMIANGNARHSEIARTFAVPLATVKRYAKLYREKGAPGFFAPRRRRSAVVLTPEVKVQAQALLDEGKSPAEVGKELSILADTLRKAIQAGHLHQPLKKGSSVLTRSASSKSERSEVDSAAEMGNGATRTLERVAAAMGDLAAAPVQFEAALDVPRGGVLLALPALLAAGLLRFTTALYSLPKGFYGVESIFLLLALMALGRIPSMEQLRYVAPGEWGNLLGLDRIPEVRTLRAKLEILCRQAGRAARWQAALAREWIGGVSEAALLFYADGHVRVYHGDLTPLPRHYVTRERLCLRATTDYWVNAMDGQPFFYVNKEVDPGLIAILRQDLVPLLQKHAPISPQLQAEMDAHPLQHRFTLVFDREGYSPEMFAEMKSQRIAVLSYHKYPGEDWPAEEFIERPVTLAGGEPVAMRLAERGTRLSNGLWVRQVRKLSESGKQTAILSTDYQADAMHLAASMFARWSQENFFRYMRQHYGLDRLVEYGTEAIPDTVRVVNPAWRQLDSQIRRVRGQRQRAIALFGAQSLAEELSEADMTRYQQMQAELQEKIEHTGQQLEQLKGQRRETPHHVTLAQLPEEERFQRLIPERKHFIDTVKMISYRAETSMASVLREVMARSDDARALLCQVYNTEADLLPDPENKTLTVSIHHLANAAHDLALRHLCNELNDTETTFPGTDLRMIYKIGLC